jgi:DNA-directed RNA polymerase subunit RPC12/RpoP
MSSSQTSASVPPELDQPVVKPPVMTAAPDSDRKFPCKQCGAKVAFDPAHRSLTCPYCGFVEKIEPAAHEEIAEHDLDAALSKQADFGQTIEGRSSQVRCVGCGAIVLLEDKVATDNCPFCGNALENKPETAKGMVLPESLLPFAIDSRKAIGAFNEWINTRWFAPNDLKRLANLGQLSGVYVPFWTYDSMTYTAYYGERGDDYWETEHYTETDSQGNTVTKTRQVRKTRWTRVSGEVDHFFDDVLVCASKSLPNEFVNKLHPWDLKDLEGFKSEFLAGFKTERYAVGLAEGFATAKEMMEAEIRILCQQDIGGDHQRLISLKTQHVGVTFKHLLLPIWLAVYRYQNRTYRILVNARTGGVTGSRPYSAWKIAGLVLGILVAVGSAVAIFALTHAR